MLEARVKMDWLANTTELANAAAESKHEIAAARATRQVTASEETFRSGPAEK
jgi:hypothetical protein